MSLLFSLVISSRSSLSFLLQSSDEVSILPAALGHELTEDAEVSELLESLVSKGVRDDHPFSVTIWEGNSFKTSEFSYEKLNQK